MGKVNALSPVVAGVGGALIDVDLAPGPGESGGAEALGHVVDSDAEAAVGAEALGADHVLALVLGGGALA